MHKKSLVYIIGFMGSGKSTAGKKLAASLGWKFIDLDKEIEETYGKTIPEIFASEGEQKFRELESLALERLQGKTETVISTGGGTPCHGDNLKVMKATGITVYLKMTPEQLEKRLLGSTGERPLLKDIPDEKLASFIASRLAEREKWYDQAQVVVEGINMDINSLTAIIRLESGTFA